MRKCCDCLLTEAVLEHAGILLEAAAENHKWLLLGSLVAGSISAAVYFFREAIGMEDKLRKLTCSLRKAEAENKVLRSRVLTLKRQKAAVELRASSADRQAEKSMEEAVRLRQDDCLARAESEKLDAEVRMLWARVRSARKQRDSFKRRLEAMICSPMESRPSFTRFTSLSC